MQRNLAHAAMLARVHQAAAHGCMPVGWQACSGCAGEIEQCCAGDLRVIQVQGLSDEVLPMVASAATSGTSPPMPIVAGSELAEPDQAAEAGRDPPKCLEEGVQATEPSL